MNKRMSKHLPILIRHWKHWNSHRFDLLILDVRLGPHDEFPEEEVGIRILEMIRQRRFIPVIFYTALPHLVQHLETSVIQVIEKTKDFAHLLAAVKKIFDAHLPVVNRALIRHLERVQRDYMWDFVAKHGAEFIDTPDRTALAYLLARRVGDVSVWFGYWAISPRFGGFHRDFHG